MDQLKTGDYEITKGHAPCATGVTVHVNNIEKECTQCQTENSSSRPD